MSAELNEDNFRRISLVNWLLNGPTLLVFGLPYYVIVGNWGHWQGGLLLGSFLFAMPFMLSVLHGHVTMAVGKNHREHYYAWLQGKPLSYGLGFHPALVTTRFRASLLAASLIWATLV